MTTISDLVETSRKYHGDLLAAGHNWRVANYVYKIDTGSFYMCALGCNFSDKETSSPVVQNSWSHIGKLVDRYNELSKKDENGLLVELASNRELLTQARVLQDIHDRSSCLETYLDKLKEWEDCGFDLKFDPYPLCSSTRNLCAY